MEKKSNWHLFWIVVTVKPSRLLQVWTAVVVSR